MKNSSVDVDGDIHLDYLLADDARNTQLNHRCISPAFEGHILHNPWGCSTDIRDDSSDSDLEDLEQPPFLILEDDKELETGFIDWAAIEANSSLSV